MKMNYHQNSHKLFIESSRISFLIIFLVIFLTIPLTYISSSDDENEDTKSIELENVLVTATRTEEEVLDVPQHVTVITKEDIKQSGAHDIAGVLKVEAGISITDYGPEGSLKAISIRGSTTSQVLILINGVKSFSSHGSGDLSLIPLENIDHIEIVRGGNSALYGADAVGGVINIITKKEDYNHLKIKIENISYLPEKALKGTGSDEYEKVPDIKTLLDTQKGNINLSYTIDDFSINTSINGIFAVNEFIFLDSTNRKRIRDNTGLIGGDVSCDLLYSLPHGLITLSGTGVYHEQESPGELGSLTPDAFQKQTGAGTTLHYQTDTLFTEILTLDIKGYYNYFELRYTDPKWSVDSCHITHSGGIDLTQEIFPSDYFSIIYGGILHYDLLDSTEMGKKERFNYAGFLEMPVYLNSYVTIFPSIRYDYLSDFGNSLNFKAGVTWNLSQSHALKGSIAKSFRAPTFNDLYWPQDTFAEGNPDLLPETGYSGDFGLTIIKNKYSLNLFCFLRYIENVILWRPGEDNIWKPSNFGEGVYPGIETQLDVQLSDTITVNLQYTGIYSFALSGELDLADDCRIPYVPVHSLDTSFNYKHTSHFFTISAHYEGSKRLSTTNRSLLPPVFLLNSYYSYNVSKYLTLYAAIDNIFNEMYQSMSNYPLPGVTLRIGCEIIFK